MLLSRDFYSGQYKLQSFEISSERTNSKKRRKTFLKIFINGTCFDYTGPLKDGDLETLPEIALQEDFFSHKLINCSYTFPGDCIDSKKRIEVVIYYEDEWIHILRV